MDAVLSVLGRQWMSRLTVKPEGNTYMERLMRHQAREELAKRWLKYLVEGLHLLLLGSIGLFIAGLLYQLWNLAMSFEGGTPRLLTTWKCGVGLSLVIVLVMLAATIHAIRYEASPFGGPFSRLIIQLGDLSEILAKAQTNITETYLKWTSFEEIWLSFLLIVFFGLVYIFTPIWIPFLLVRLCRVEVDVQNSGPGVMIGTYMELIAEASDPMLLERAVPSFSYSEWVAGGKAAMEQMLSAYNRLMATDTSLRVRETLNARFSAFAVYCRENPAKARTGLTRALIEFFAGEPSFPRRFQAQLLFISLGKDNSDLLPLASLEFQECVARVLCCYNHEGKLGRRREVVVPAERYCRQLLDDGKEEDLKHIFAYVD